MHPVICQIGPLTVYSFGLMFLLALVLCSFLLSREAKHYGIAYEEIYDFIFWVILSGLVGARLFFILLNLPFFIANPSEILMLQKGGLAWQGGLIMGILAGVLYARKLKIPILFMMDLSAPYLALGQAIGRIGCFLNGCCYGRHYEHGIFFPVHNDRLYPTQLYDFVALTAIFFILKFSRKYFPRQGQVFAAYCVLAAVERFANEYFRGDHAELYWGLSIFQVVSAVIFAGGLVLAIVLQHRSYPKLTHIRREKKQRHA